MKPDLLGSQKPQSTELRLLGENCHTKFPSSELCLLSVDCDFFENFFLFGPKSKGISFLFSSKLVVNKKLRNAHVITHRVVQ